MRGGNDNRSGPGGAAENTRGIPTGQRPRDCTEHSFGRRYSSRTGDNIADQNGGSARLTRPRARLPVTCAPGHHGPVDSDWNRFIFRCQQALGDLVEGRPEPFKALWSHADDVVIMGAFGGYERGWEQVSARLDWAAAGIKATDRAAENIVTVVGDDLAYTVDLEHMTRYAGDQPQPRILRCTQAYRRENGRWKVILRHADELPRKDEQQK